MFGYDCCICGDHCGLEGGWLKGGLEGDWSHWICLECEEWFED